MALNTKALEEFADLYLEKLKTQKKLKELNEQITQKQQALIDHMASEGVNKLSLTEGRTIGVYEEIWPQYGEKQNAIKALKAAGIDDLVEENFNHNRLASFIRERLKQGKELPREFSGLIKAETVYKLKARKL